MRNLKRVLSLALACVMVIGMMVMTTGAADIADIDEVKNTEAVTVMNALKVLEGDENGVYNPNGILTREQAAKIICVMLMGKDNADLLVGTSNFTDVAANRWSAGYIAYCASLDIISGYAGEFNPTGELTGVAFAKMLLVALGYDAAVEGYVNNANWATNIGSDAIDAGLNVKGVDLSAALTRDNAAQMAFQALEADMVEYETKGTTISVNGIDIVSGASKAEAKGNDGGEDYTTATTNDGKEDTLQFCEKYFEDLTKDAGTEDFGRPCSHAWTMKNETVYTAVNTPVATFSAKTIAKGIVNKLSGYKFVYNNGTPADPTDDITYKVNTTVIDEENPTNIGLLTVAANKSVADAIAALTTNGDVVEIYANPKTKVITHILPVNYSAAVEVKSIKTDNKTGDVTYKIGATDYVDYADDEVNTDEIFLHGDIAKGDWVTTATAAGVLHVYPTTTFEGTQTATKTAQGVQTITVDGEKYTVGVNATGDFNNQKNAYTYYVDQYGFVVYCAPITDTASTDYLQIVNIDMKETSTLGAITPSAKVRAVLADGTVGVYDLDITKKGPKWYAGNIELGGTDVSDNTFTGVAQYGIYGYTIENGKLALESLTDMDATLTADDAAKIYQTNAASNLDANNFADSSNTILLTQTTTFVIYNIEDEEATVFTGYDKLADLTDEANVMAVVKAGVGAPSAVKNCKALVVFATVADAEKIAAADSDNYVYAVANDFTLVGSGATAKYVYTGFAPDGSEVEFSTKAQLGADGLYTLTEDGSVNTTALTGDKYLAATTLTVSNDMVKSGGNFYYMTEDTEVIYVDGRLDEVNGNIGVVVLNKDLDTAVAIFMVAAGE